MNTLLAVLGSGLLGLAFGAVARRLLARLRRGAVIKAGRLEAAAGVVTGLGTYLAFDGRYWPLVTWVGLLGVVLTAVDLKHHRLPDAITLPAIPVTLAVAALSGLGALAAADLWRAVIAGAVVGGAFWAIALVAPSAMGRGDAKLAFSVGIALGYLSWTAVLFGVFLAFCIGAAVGLIGIVAGRLRLRSAIAFGPSMLLGCWLVLAVPQLLRLIDSGRG